MTITKLIFDKITQLMLLKFRLIAIAGLDLLNLLVFHC